MCLLLPTWQSYICWSLHSGRNLRSLLWPHTPLFFAYLSISSVQRMHGTDSLVSVQSSNCIWMSWKFASETLASILSGFLLPLQQQCSNWKTSLTMKTLKSTAFWLLVWKKWCLEKEIAKEIENYELTQLNTLLEWFFVKIKKTWLNLGNDNSISLKEIWTQTAQFLELLSWTLNLFFQTSKMWKYHVLTVCGCFDQMHKVTYRVWINYFCTRCACFASA